ncbi:aminotransferase class I/II-fold pyridoxal phosphate-dependent enzyme [Lentiprolixibacter aurantiacus]|uniref:8-amino-7-oxononanoate synthase n=1 Tax=Lentiprolixibacter aurantiacus TaxID=2993939 RepID=A0AAE3SMH3_9FLAO|nr:8-amino-7-oxononanoate synthase [Lentiprolixibacter aurantiacus]MCX2718291.1 8-amino-7-oxononanoate synthase [Lentiprolixibacter aurantiacus]
MPYICCMDHFPGRLKKKLDQREADNSLRNLTSMEGKIDFCSNDYLGFARNEDLFDRISEYLKKHQLKINGSTGSRLLSGNSALSEGVEQMLADYYHAEAALIFNSGYDANLGFFGSVPQKGDLILYDELSHASIRDGISMSHAKAYKFQHNNLQDFEAKLDMIRARIETTPDNVVYVVTESVFSMDGDSPDLDGMVTLCRQYGANLIVDEAHAVGIFGTAGAGLLESLGLQDEVFARVVTFGKALGTHGAAILGSKDLVRYLINFARSFVYTTALPPHSLVAIRESHGLLKESIGQKQVSLLKKNIAYFRSRIEELGFKEAFIQSNSAIQSCILPDNLVVKQVARDIQDRGIDVRPILAPTVPKGKERIRLILHSFNKKDEIDVVLKLLYTLWKKR